MKKLYGGYNITKAMGYPPVDYIKITTFLNLIEAPMVINNRGANVYCLTEKQVEFLKKTLRKLREELKK